MSSVTTYCERCGHEEGVHQDGVCKGRTRRNTDCHCPGFSPLIMTLEEKTRWDQLEKEGEERVKAPVKTAAAAADDQKEKTSESSKVEQKSTDDGNITQQEGSKQQENSTQPTKVESQETDAHIRQQQTHELEVVIEEVKHEFRKLIVKRRELIIKLGEAFERVVSDPESVCEEIKNTLREEIRDKVISTRDIERYCPDKWKKKTKPKNDNLSFSKPQQRIAPTREGKSVIIDERASQDPQDAEATLLLKQKYEDEDEIVEPKDKDKSQSERELGIDMSGNVVKDAEIKPKTTDDNLTPSSESKPENASNNSNDITSSGIDEPFSNEQGPPTTSTTTQSLQPESKPTTTISFERPSASERIEELEAQNARLLEEIKQLQIQIDRLSNESKPFEFTLSYGVLSDYIANEHRKDMPEDFSLWFNGEISNTGKVLNVKTGKLSAVATAIDEVETETETKDIPSVTPGSTAQPPSPRPSSPRDTDIDTDSTTPPPSEPPLPAPPASEATPRGTEQLCMSSLLSITPTAPITPTPTTPQSLPRNDGMFLKIGPGRWKCQMCDCQPGDRFDMVDHFCDRSLVKKTGRPI